MSRRTPPIIMQRLNGGSIVIMVIQVLFLSLICHYQNVNAHLIDAYEQAMQDWDISLNCGSWNQGPSLLFPLSKSAVDARIPDTRTNKRGFWRKNSVKCKLSMFTNGTFSLAPSDDYGTPPVLPLRGKWILRPNPYCITDRHFDELELAAYPRVQKKVTTKKLANNASQVEEQVLQEIRVKLYCHISGRYGTSAIRNLCRYRDGKIMGRISRGSLLWDTVHSFPKELPWWRKRRIGATFQGRPHTTSISDGKDEEYSLEE